MCAQLEGLQSTVTGHVERALELEARAGAHPGGKGAAGTGRQPCSQPRTGTYSGLFPSDSTERRLERALAEGQQRGGQLQEQLTQQLSQALSSRWQGGWSAAYETRSRRRFLHVSFTWRLLGGPGSGMGPPCQTSSHGSAPVSFPLSQVSPRVYQAGQLSNSVATKLTAVESSMKENISKLLKSKVL